MVMFPSFDSGLAEMKMTPVKIKDLLIAFPPGICLFDKHFNSVSETLDHLLIRPTLKLTFFIMEVKTIF